MTSVSRPAGADPGHAVEVTIRRWPIQAVEPFTAYQALARRFGRDQVYLLESRSGQSRESTYHFTGFGLLLSVSVVRGQVRIEGVPAARDAVSRRIAPLLNADGRLTDRQNLWRMLRDVQSAFRAPGSASRFEFGFLSYFGYDTAWYIEDLPYLIGPRDDQPDVQMDLYQGCLRTDVVAGRSDLLLYECAWWPRLAGEEIAGLLAAPVKETGPAAVPRADSYHDDTTPADYTAKVQRSLEHIAAGDIYQVQIGHEFTIGSPAEPLAVYRRLRERNPSPFMCLAPMGERTIVGASPELFVRIEDGIVTMRPIAGTVPRVGTSDGDMDAGRRLRSDPKERAEHTMLVDLSRNDIGRICQRDTLAVPEAMLIEQYSHVLHLVSTVTGQAEGGKDAFDIIPALFPAGTMTGAPKIRAMEIIEELEHSRRGLYAGAIGLLDVGGYANLCLCIRSLVHYAGQYRARASAGIVADSDPGREWAETMAKAGAAYWAVTGMEL
jgi:anthranilate/para-aminobenzoate synthase component I